MGCAQVAVEAGAFEFAGAWLRFAQARGSPCGVAARAGALTAGVWQRVCAVQGLGRCHRVCAGILRAAVVVLLRATVRAVVALVPRCSRRVQHRASTKVHACCVPPLCAVAFGLSLRPGRSPPVVAMATSTEGTSTGSCSESGASPLRGPDPTRLSAAAELCGIGPDAIESLKTKSLADSILALREEQLRVRADRKRVAKELKNAQRRKRRLKEKARQLTNTDLVEVLLMRQAEKTELSSQETGEAADPEATADKGPAAEEAGSEA